MSNNGDYGYFGTGSTGYAHYMQSFNETTSSTSYSKSHLASKENKGDDTFWLMIAIVFAPLWLVLAVPVFILKILLD